MRKYLIMMICFVALLSTSIFAQTPVSVNIAPNMNPVDAGTKVLFTSTITWQAPVTGIDETAAPVKQASATTTPITSYQWILNNQNVAGATATTYKLIPINGDIVNFSVITNYGKTSTSISAKPVTMKVNPVLPNTCPGTPTVTYAGKTYNTVQIGTQCWMRENLNIGTRIDGSQVQTNNGIIEKYCYNNLESNCDVSGGLYNWAEIVQYQNGATTTKNWNPIPTGNVQGICPPGWHLPTNAEWVFLYNYLGGQYVAGGKLKEAGLAHWLSPNKSATNSTYFTGLPAGFRWTTGAFMYGNKDVSYWTVTGGYDNGVTAMRYGGLTYGTANANNGEYYKTNAASVRCIKD